MSSCQEKEKKVPALFSFTSFLLMVTKETCSKKKNFLKDSRTF